MKKTIAGLCVIIILAACNNTGKEKQDHQQHTPAAITDSAIKINEMKTLMDGMMAQMHSVTATGNNDIDFAAQMIEHHRGAVAMAKLEQSKGTDSVLKTFATKVIADQQKEITLMNDFITRHKATPSANSKDFLAALNGSMTAMMNDNTILYDNIDKDFAAQMIPHHQSAVDMAKAYLQYGNNVVLKKLAEDITTAQTSEIDWLKNWLAQHR